MEEPVGPAGVTDEEDLLGVSERRQGLLLFDDPSSAIIGPRCVGEATLQRLERLLHDQVTLLVQVDVKRAATRSSVVEEVPTRCLVRDAAIVAVVAALLDAHAVVTRENRVPHRIGAVDTLEGLHRRLVRGAHLVTFGRVGVRVEALLGIVEDAIPVAIMGIARATALHRENPLVRRPTDCRIDVDDWTSAVQTAYVGVVVQKDPGEVLNVRDIGRDGAEVRLGRVGRERRAPQRVLPIGVCTTVHLCRCHIGVEQRHDKG